MKKWSSIDESQSKSCYTEDQDWLSKYGSLVKVRLTASLRSTVEKKAK